MHSVLIKGDVLTSILAKEVVLKCGWHYPACKHWYYRGSASHEQKVWVLKHPLPLITLPPMIRGILIEGFHCTHIKSTSPVEGHEVLYHVQILQYLSNARLVSSKYTAYTIHIQALNIIVEIYMFLSLQETCGMVWLQLISCLRRVP